MKSKLTLMSLVALFAFILGAGFNNIAMSDVPAQAPSGIKIAVVDVNKVVSDSKEVKALKAQQDKKKDELVKWLETVKTDINKQSTDENKVKLAKKYDSELAKKQEANRKDYTAKLQKIDKNISNIINQTAKAQGYTIVFSKSSVLYGGDDITSVISKAVK